MSYTVLQAKVTKTAAFTGTTQVDVSGYTSNQDYTIRLHVHGLEAGKVANFTLEGTVDNFTTPVVIAQATVIGGGVNVPSDRIWRKNQLPAGALFFGITSGEVRLNLASITGTSNCTYEAVIET